MSDDDPASWGATPAASGNDPAAWGAKPADSGFSWSRAVTDIPHEIGQEAGSALTDIGNLSNRSEQGPIEGLMTTGKAALAVPRLLASPITGAARSLIGHPMANLEHAAGTVINPEVAAKDNPEQMYETAKGDVDTAMSAVRPAGAPVKVPGAGYEWKGPPQVPKPTGVVKQPETEAFFDSADNHYSNMRGFGVEIDPRAMNGVADNIINELYAEGYRPRNSKVFDDVEELRKPAGQNHEISDIDSVRKVLRRTSLDLSERDAARRAIGHIDDYLVNLKNNPQDVVVNPHFAAQVSDEAVAARGDYAVAKRSEDVDEAMDKAQRQAASGGAGGNINNATRQQLKSLRNNKKKMIGWSDDEKAELDAVINGSTVANATRQAGKFAPHGIVSTVMSAGAGHALAPGFGEVAVPAAGWIAKKIGDRLTQKAAERLSDVVKARSPLGKQTSVNAAAQSALAPSSSNPRLLSTGVAAGLPRQLPAINIRPLTAEGTNQNQNPTAGFARGGNVNHAHSSGEDHSGRAAAEKALPANHKLGMKVPKGGSNCAKCRFLSSPTTCGNKGFVEWNGGAKLPAPADQYCCDLYEKAHGFAHGGAVHNSHPTEAQKKAGNYAKTHKFFQGLDITIENLKGSNRTGVSKDGKSWSVKMPAHYGYIKRTEGADGDHVDCYLGPNEKSDQVFVVDQKDDKTGRFDEHKCLLGFSNEREAKQHYLAGFSDGKNRIKNMRRMSMDEFREWLEKGDTSKEIHKYATGGAVRRAMDSGGATDFDTEWQDRAWPTYPETMHQMQRTKPDLYKALNSEASARREEETPRSFNDRFRPIHQMDIYDAGGAVNRAVRAAKGFADGGAPDDSYDPFAAEKFVNPEVSQAVGNLTQTSRPVPDPNDPILYRTASPLVNITQGDIERGMNVGMSTGPGTIGEQAPKFYSALDQAVESLPLNKATGQQWLGTLTNKGVKGEEMEHRGVADFLAENANRPVTKEEVQNHLAGNKVELGEVNKGGERPTTWTVTSAGMSPKKGMPPPPVRFGSQQEAEVELARREAEYPGAYHNVAELPTAESKSKFESYQLPGGENYREKLLTLPSRTPAKTGDPMKDIETAVNADNYHSSHWDEPNVLVHRRTNEREVNGVPSLHLEEIQSDWHQQGRSKGYSNPAEIEAKQEALKQQINDAVSERAKYAASRNPEERAAYQAAAEKEGQLIDEYNRLHDVKAYGAPDAPFKKNWHELALKDAIREAAEKGFDRISWTPGEAQAARYDLSKQIHKLELTHNKEGAGELIMHPLGNDRRPQSVGIKSKDDLVNAVGKDLADKLYEQGYKNNGKAELEGLELKVGGEGMKGFYDKMILDAMNKIGKPHGVKVQKGTTHDPSDLRNEMNELMGKKTNIPAVNPVHYMDIPESLKKEALHKGFKMFADGGAVTLPKPAKTGGRISYPAALKTAYAIKRVSQ